MIRETYIAPTRPHLNNATVPVKGVGYVKPGRPTGSALSETMKKLNQCAFASFCVQARDIILTGLRLYYEGAVDA